MAKKIKLGLNLFFNNSTNSGIVNYIYNIISALKVLPEKEQPRIIVFFIDGSPVEFIKKIEYPDISFIFYQSESPLKLLRMINSFFVRVTNKNFFIQNKYLNKIDVLYPYFEFLDQQFRNFKHKIHWLVDFNNCVFPGHYADNASFMNDFQQKLTLKNDHVILSSETLLNELRHYYPQYNNKISVVRFACTLPDFDYVDIESLKLGHQIIEPYFMSPNQFWEHKNQLVVIEALRVVKEKGRLDFQVVFTGSMEVNRGKGHMLSKLIALVDKYNLQDHVKFLGLIDRDQQIALMKHAVSLIQPSLYEGWSTLVEEAKALNQRIILSDLPVHREQNCVNSYFFDPYSSLGLAEQIAKVLQEERPPLQIDYSHNILQFGLDFLQALNDEVSGK